VEQESLVSSYTRINIRPAARQNAAFCGFDLQQLPIES